RGHPAVCQEIGFIQLVWDGLERQLSLSPFYRWKPEAQRGSLRGVTFLHLPLWETQVDIHL
uniref:Uncharacterized protein n=1 Tax=Saimiri boliviensis boliviensis TaxID=39432 RepID=A0A2K6SAG5_SAIBB